MGIFSGKVRERTKEKEREREREVERMRTIKKIDKNKSDGYKMKHREIIMVLFVVGL